MVPVKNNLAPLGNSLTYQIMGTADAIPYLAWDKQTRAIDANEVLGMSQKEKHERVNRRGEAEEWLRARLADGPVLQKELESAAKSAGIAWRTLRRAKDKLRVQSHKAGIGGGWFWELAENGGHDGPQDGQDALHR
jgi:hypothetical protein